MKEKIFGVPQQIALDWGLDFVDLILYEYLAKKECTKGVVKKEFEGATYVWLSYGEIVAWLPILNIKKRAVAARFDKLIAAGLVAKYVDMEGGNYTYFRTLLQKQQTGCCPDNTPLSPKQQTKNNRRINTVEEKEKDNNKLLSKKKDLDSFEWTFERFMAKAVEDNEFKYSLRGYNITNLAALIEAFKTHVTNLCRHSEFIDNGYVRNRSWLLRSMPYLDVREATGSALGYGEYLMNNKRWYRNRNGKEIEVPMNAPPRRKGMIWYKEQGHWGPDI